MGKSRRILAGASVVLALGAMVVAASPAVAGGRDGVCDDGEFCYYFNSGNQGSVSDFAGSVSNYASTQPSCYDFKGPGAGQGTCVKNAAASVWNRSRQVVRVFYNSGHAGTHQDFGPGVKGNLIPALKNQNASHRFQGTGTPTGCKTDGTDTRMPTTILVYLRARNEVVRVGFKDYVKNVLPNEWMAHWPEESLRAGAVAAKNFGWYWALHSNKKKNGMCYDVEDNTNSQVYRPGSARASTNAAVDATWGDRLTRGGRIFNAQYCRTHTECGHWRDGAWMSQMGSRDMANQGRTYREILARYYKGVVLQ
ncbi:SpoIID/LytB domain-containing protein [Nonomuraea typhae]|uniref:SpoIID/LytB domain-containing protein n=1 Tax=Nonomuraea typhae TaxID=2603600 RepID=UPI0012F84D87|nr:SpoIID/LytB domain-containing protein [Nonomuraea typhae]